MKNHSIITDLAFFLLILSIVISPIILAFFYTFQNFNQWNFPFSQMLSAFFALFIYLFYWEKSDEKINKTVFLITKLFPGILCLCLLFCSALLLKGLTFIVKNPFWTGNQEVLLPGNFIEYLFCILGFVFAAFYEEVIYRFYLPEILISFVFKKIGKKSALILSEVLALIIFSLAHLYLGGFAVINAIAGHCILRLCFKKSKSLWPGFTAHFIYNLLILFLL